MYRILIYLFISLLLSSSLNAKSSNALEIDVDFAIKQFKLKVNGGEKFLSKVKGYLVIPTVIKGGFVVGAEYGEGALRVNGATQHYYSMTSASVGYQAGVQLYSIVLAFISQNSLDNFVKSNGWEAGVNGSIAVSTWGKGTNISTISYEKPIVAFIFGQKGLMAGVSIKGTKFLRIIPQ